MFLRVLACALLAFVLSLGSVVRANELPTGFTILVESGGPACYSEAPRDVPFGSFSVASGACTFHLSEPPSTGPRHAWRLKLQPASAEGDG
jgi:hypothetical protein